MPSQFVPFLAQRFGQTRAQILGRLAARILTDLDALLRDGRRFFEKLLSGRLTIERLYFAQLADRKIAGIDGGDIVDHRSIVWSKRIYYRWHHRIVIAFNLRPVLCQRGPEA